MSTTEPIRPHAAGAGQAVERCLVRLLRRHRAGRTSAEVAALRRAGPATADRAPHRGVVGGGGLQAAPKLARLPVEVTLVDRRNLHLFQPRAYQVATGALRLISCPGTEPAPAEAARGAA
jgi:hypothetical protein